MSQINLGLVNVTNGSPTVVSNDDADWSAVRAGHIFTIFSSGVFYTIAGNATRVSSHWTLTLTGNYGSTTATNQNYIIHSSFTPIHGIPYPEQGDTQTAAIVKRAMLELDQIVGPLVQGAVTLTDASTIAADATLFVPGAVGTVTLTANRTLTISNAVDGQTLNFRIKQDGTGGHTLTVTNGRATTTISALTLNSAANAYTYFTLRYELTENKFSYVALVN